MRTRTNEKMNEQKFIQIIGINERNTIRCQLLQYVWIDGFSYQRRDVRLGVLAMIPLAMGKILKGCSDAGPKKNADRTSKGSS